jgi:8-oxo-dGTP pyrophosphatase MutT (NUDIX family)
MDNPIFNNRPNNEYKVDRDKTIWESRSNGLNAVIFGICSDNIFVLAEKRSSTIMDLPNRWCLPCGYLDWDETGWEGLVREVYEETSFFIPKYKNNLIFDNDKQPFFVNTDPKENRQNVALNYCLIFDFSKGLPNHVESYKDEEISQIKWIPIEHIKKYNFAFNHDKRIEMAIEKFENYFM